MYIDAKYAEGYVVVCDHKAEDHVFMVGNLGPSVECPKCGATALSGDLATDFVCRRRKVELSKDWRSSLVLGNRNCAPRRPTEQAA